jgi:hypothetical protein
MTYYPIGLEFAFKLIKKTKPEVDIKANGSNGPIAIDYNSSATLSWTSKMQQLVRHLDLGLE